MRHCETICFLILLIVVLMFENAILTPSVAVVRLEESELRNLGAT